jgi:hypothetical protein
MRGEVAVEYMIVISLALIFLIPLSIYLGRSLIGYEESARISQARDVIVKLGESANWVWSQGSPAKLTLDVCIPEGVEKVVLDNIILFRLRTSTGVSDVYYYTIPQLNGTIPTKAGCYKLSLIAEEEFVNVTLW